MDTKHLYNIYSLCLNLLFATVSPFHKEGQKATDEVISGPPTFGTLHVECSQTLCLMAHCSTSAGISQVTSWITAGWPWCCVYNPSFKQHTSNTHTQSVTWPIWKTSDTHSHGMTVGTTYFQVHVFKKKCWNMVRKQDISKGVRALWSGNMFQMGRGMISCS